MCSVEGCGTKHIHNAFVGEALSAFMDIYGIGVTVDPHLSEHCETEASSDMPNVRICEINIFSMESLGMFFQMHTKNLMNLIRSHKICVQIIREVG